MLAATKSRSPRFFFRHTLPLVPGPRIPSRSLLSALLLLGAVILAFPSRSQAQTDLGESVENMQTQSELIERARNQLADDDLDGLAETVGQLRQVTPNHRSLILFDHALRHFNAPRDKSNPLLGLLPPEEPEAEDIEPQTPAPASTPEPTPTPAPTPEPTVAAVPEATPDPVPFATAPLLGDAPPPPPPKGALGGLTARLREGDVMVWGGLVLLGVFCIWFVGRAFRGAPQPIAPEPEKEPPSAPPAAIEKPETLNDGDLNLDLDLDPGMPRSISEDSQPSEPSDVWHPEDSGDAAVLPIASEGSESSEDRGPTHRAIPNIIEESKEDTGPITLEVGLGEPDQAEPGDGPVFVFDDSPPAPEPSPQRAVEEDIEIEDISPQQIMSAMADEEPSRPTGDESMLSSVGTTSAPEFDFSAALNLAAEEEPSDPEESAEIAEERDLPPADEPDIEMIPDEEEDDELPTASTESSAPHITLDAQTMPSGDTLFHSDEDTVVHFEGQAEDTYFHSDEDTVVPPDTQDETTKQEPDGASPFHSMDDTVVSDLDESDDEK